MRHGVMVVGLTLTGKTKCQNALANALGQLRRDGEEALDYEVLLCNYCAPISTARLLLY